MMQCILSAVSCPAASCGDCGYPRQVGRAGRGIVHLRYGVILLFRSLNGAWREKTMFEGQHVPSVRA
jgi:hypothetical protein